MNSEQDQPQNPIEQLAGGVERRFVIGFNDSGTKVTSPLVVANEPRLSKPLRLNHARLAELGLANYRTKKGGFCIRNGEQILMTADSPMIVVPASQEEFNKALDNGLVIITPENP